MDHTTFEYTIFIIVLLAAIIVDLGVFSKKGQTMTLKTALYQTIFWIGLALAYWIFVWYEDGTKYATKYISAYLMEKSLSIDNIFVFIIIFGYFHIKASDKNRALLIGVLLAIVFRIVFIALGVEIIARFHWIMYVFGAFLLYTGLKMFQKKGEDHQLDLEHNKLFKWANRVLPITYKDSEGKYFTKINGKTYLTTLSIVVLVIAVTDVVFAVDSIPTVVSLVRDSPTTPFTDTDIMIIYSSNIFAILGLRSLFFLLQGMADKFEYLQQGIAVVLIYIGLKMLVEYFNIHIPIGVSLAVIVLSVSFSIFYSIYNNKRKLKRIRKLRRERDSKAQ